MSFYKKIAQLRERYYKSLSNKEPLIKIINEAEVFEHVYNSNAIENSTLSLEETEKILMQIDLNRYVSERELFEAKNLAKVLTYIDKITQEKELDLELILFLHKMLISNIDDSIAGRLRRFDEFVRVGSHIAPSGDKLEKLLNDMLLNYKAKSEENIIKKISKLHLEFESIHPFVDGNGRIGRVINNYLLIREGFVPINIKFIDRQKYYDSFKEYDNLKQSKKMEEIVGKALTSSYYKRLAYLEEKQIIKLSDFAKKNKLSYPNLINKAKRQTIEAFLERGTWKIGV